VLVRPEELAPDAPARRVFSLPDAVMAQAQTREKDDVRVPPSLAFGIREREERMLFGHLPLLSADMNTRHEMLLSGGAGGAHANANLPQKSVEAMSSYHETQLAAGMAQANVLARVVDLRNANAAGIAFENRRRVIETFSEPGKPNDSGRTEVQGALSCCVCTLLQSTDYYLSIFALSWFPSCVIDPSSTQCMEPPPRI
jgi:small subunit ribosomal protein S15